MRAAGVEQDDVVGVVEVLVGEVERAPDLGVAQAAVAPLRDLMKDALELLALEPCGRRIERVQVCGVGRFIVVAVVLCCEFEAHCDGAVIRGRPTFQILVLRVVGDLLERSLAHHVPGAVVDHQEVDRLREGWTSPIGHLEEPPF
jgi:hypothetical protein